MKTVVPFRRIIWLMTSWGLLVFAAILPVGLLSFYSYRLTEQTIRRLVEANNSSAGAIAAQLVERELELSISLVRAYPLIPGMVEAAEDRDEEAVRVRLRVLLEAYPRFDRAYLADLTGLLWSDFPRAPESLGVNFSDREWHSLIAPGWTNAVVSGVYQRNAEPKPLVLAIAAPIHNAARQPLGALVCQYRPEKITDWLRRTSVGQGGFVYVLDHSGAVVAHPRLDLQTRVYRDYRDVPVIKLALRGTAQSVEYTDPFAGQQMVATITPVQVGTKRWVVVAQQPVTEAYAPIAELRQQLVLGGGVLGLAALIGVVVLGVSSQRNERMRLELAQHNQQLQQLAAIVEHSDDAIFSMTLDGIVTSANPGVQKIYGYESSELVGQTVTVLVPADRPDEVPNNLEKIRRGEHVEHFETVRIAKGGRRIDVSLTMSPIKDEAGEVIGASIIARDITANKQAEENVRRERDRAQRYLDVAGVMLVIVNADQTVGLINKMGCQILGYPERDILGKNWFDHFLPAEIREDVRGVFHDLVAGDYALAEHHENPVRSKGGEQRLILWHNILLYDEAGRIEGVLSSGEDITERRQVEQQLRLFFDVTLDMLCIADFQGYFIRLSPTWTKTMGWSEAELMAKPFIEFVHPDDRQATLRAAARLSTGKEVVGFDNRYRCKDGTYRWISWNSFGLVDRGLIIAAARDITDRKRDEEQLRRTADELARSNTELEQFAYIASHDLQEPLRTVISFLQLLERRLGDRLDKDCREFIGYAVDGAGRMRNLIHDLLEYSRVGTRGKPFAATNMETVLKEALTNLHAAIEDSGARVSHTPLPTVTGDAGQLVQVLQNLISNALKYRGAAPPVVRVAATARDGQWEFAVTDNGIGIDRQFFERIFVIFQRLHRRAEYSGTGIGLAICRRIVQRHGGRMWVESEPGKGSTFFFTMPQTTGESI